jgi:hypothetical protein
MLAHLLWAAVAVYALHRVSAVVERFAPVRSSPADLVPPVVEVPEDLMAVSMQERESWAQEEVLRAIRERYEELRDWNKVRAAVGVGRID